MSPATSSGRRLGRDLGVRLSSTRQAFGNPNLGRLLLVWGIWVTADWALLITVSVMALELGGPAAVGLVGVVRVLPSALLTGPASILADRWSRGRLLAAATIGWAAIAGLLAWFALVEAPLGGVLVALAAGSMLASVLRPTMQAMIPTLVDSPSQLITANSAWATIEALGTVLGPALCAVLLTTLGAPGIFVLLAGLFLVAAVAGGSIRTAHQPARRAAGPDRRDWLAPLRGFAVLSRPGARVVVGLFFGQTTMRGLLNVFVVLVATTLLGGGESLVGSLFLAMGVGGLAGALLGLALGGRPHAARWVALGVCLWGLPVLVMGLWTTPPVAHLCLATIGVGNALLDVFGYSLLNRLFPDHLAGRAWGAFHTGSAAVVAVGSAAAPILVAGLGLTWAMVLVGLLLAVAPLLTWPGLRRVDGMVEGRAEDVATLRQVAIFEPLSLIAVERLARAARQLEFESGRVLIEQGEPARDFYVLTAGEVSVHQDGREIGRLGPLESFGEVGLLQGGPRTATVRAEGAGRLLALDSESFVAAVTGHRGTDTVAQDRVARYLDRDRNRRDLGR